MKLVKVAIVALVAAAHAGIAAGQTTATSARPAGETTGFSLLPSYDFSSGKYGSADTTITKVLSLTAMYDQPNYLLTLTLPYIWQGGPSGNVRVTTATGGTSIVPLNQVPGNAVIVQPAGGAQSVSGQGDVYLGGTRFFRGARETDAVYSLGAQYKFGTASADKGLGTKKDDYSLLGGVSKKTGEQLTLSGTLGYAHYGSPAGVTLKNGYWALFAADNALSSASAVGATLFAGQRIADGSSGPSEATVYYRYDLNKTTMLRAYLLKGLSNGSPNYGAGLSALVSF